MNYLLWANIYLAVFYIFYWVLLRKETFFQLNRQFLLGSTLFSFVVPLLDFRLFSLTSTNPAISYLNSIEIDVNQVAQVDTNPSSNLSVLMPIYLTGCLLSFCWLLYRIILLKRDINGHHHGEAYSFFNCVKVDPDLEQRDKIILHELIHVKQFHSLDILLIEIAKIFNWFNPIVYLLARSLKLTHEYIADEKTANFGDDRIEYANLLVSQAFAISHHSLKNSFFNKSFLKNRIAMLLKNKSKKLVLIRFSLLIPIVLIALAFQPISSPESQTPITEVSTDSTKLKSDTGAQFRSVETPPQPVGGMQKFYQYIGKNYNYPKEAVAAKLDGRVMISFVVEEDGSLSDFKILRDLGYGTGEEAIRMLKNGPKWNPGILKGKPVRVQFTLPIQLNKKKEDEKPIDSQKASTQNEQAS